MKTLLARMMDVVASDADDVKPLPGVLHLYGLGTPELVALVSRCASPRALFCETAARVLLRWIRGVRPPMRAGRLGAMCARFWSRVRTNRRLRRRSRPTPVCFRQAPPRRRRLLERYKLLRDAREQYDKDIIDFVYIISVARHWWTGEPLPHQSQHCYRRTPGQPARANA